MLTKKEQAALPFFIKEMKTAHGKDEAITLGWFVDQWNADHPSQTIKDANGRRIIRHIRDNGLVKRLMADRYGYFIARNAAAYEKYVEMIGRRMKRMTQTYKALKRQQG